MGKTLESLALLAAVALGGTAWAAGKAKPMDKAAYAAEKTRIEAQYKVEKVQETGGAFANRSAAARQQKGKDS